MPGCVQIQTTGNLSLALWTASIVNSPYFKTRKPKHKKHYPRPKGFLFVCLLLMFIICCLACFSITSYILDKPPLLRSPMQSSLSLQDMEELDDFPYKCKSVSPILL